MVTLQRLMRHLWVTCHTVVGNSICNENVHSSYWEILVRPPYHATHFAEYVP